jgi:hypothetical protein
MWGDRFFNAHHNRFSTTTTDPTASTMPELNTALNLLYIVLVRWCSNIAGGHTGEILI